MHKKALLAWYDQHQRLLPWRIKKDPYRIWVSEVMLQQTQVKTVIPYYEAFLQRFPTVDSLASAAIDDVLALWSGLGYYRRARQMHAAAQKIVDLGAFPETLSQLQELPGIGPYTAAAIASMAFDEPVPVLDGNVERVLSRRLGSREDPKKVATRRRLFEAGGELLDLARPGDSNQALMELGATICRPKGPRCEVCPLSEGCRALLLGDPEGFPAPRRRRTVERVELAVAVIVEKGRVLLFRRSEDSHLLAGLWELPGVPRQRSLVRMEEDLESRYGGRWKLKAKRGRVRHGITYRDLRIHVYPGQFFAGETVAEGPEAAWVSKDQLKSYPISSAVEKVLALEPLD